MPAKMLENQGSPVFLTPEQAVTTRLKGTPIEKAL
jgi:hypothetical protein